MRKRVGIDYDPHLDEMDRKLRERHARGEKQDKIQHHGKINKSTNKSGKPQYIVEHFEMIDDPDWRRNNRCPHSTYLYLRRRVVRGVNGEPINDEVYHRYWTDNKFAVSLSKRYIALKFGFGRNSYSTIDRHIDYLFSKGAFEYGKDIIIKGKPKPQKVYILGKNLQKKDIWYYESRWIQKPK